MRLRIVRFAVAVLATVLTLAAARAADSSVSITVRADKPGAVIDKNVYGQFSEHLGSGIYGGVYVGKDSPIPNADGFRNDVIAALKDLHVPVVRWPGGCFADEYHWRDGVGPQDTRPVRVNHNWGGVPETNAFGTHEFFEFVSLIGADAYVNANVGTGSPQEMADWLEYMTSPMDTELTRMRKANGRDKPWPVAMYAMGNESWGCGGSMRPQYYADLFKHYATFVRMAQAPKPIIIAVGDSDAGTEWTKTLMAQAKGNMDALSLHYYTLPTGSWSHKGAALGFGEDQWISTFAQTLKMDDFIKAKVTIMDAADPAKKVGLYVDEWGTWYDPEPGTNPGFLVQQNSLRDALVAAANFHIFHKYADRVRMTAIAQTVNVLQSMIVTDGPRMIKTPTYYAYQMYIPFQGATMLPVERTAPPYRFGTQSLPQVSATAARTKSGDIVVGLINIDPHHAVPVAIDVDGAPVGDVGGTILTADAMDAHNSFDDPDAVHPVPFAGARVEGGKLTLTLPPKSVVVLRMK